MSEQLTVGELVYKISGDMDNLKTELKRADAEIQNLKTSMEKGQVASTKLGSSFGLLKGLIAGVVATKAFQFFKDSANEAIKLGESVNAVNVVFGSGADNILKYGENAATSVGLARSEYNQMATITGALLKDTGLTMDEVAEQTNDLVVRASDMASVFNTSVPDALSAVNQALRGETEAIRRYAGDVTDASLQTFLYSKGINKTVTELTEQEKRLYRVDLIMSQTEVTAGDFARTSDSLANQQRILSSRWKDGTAQLGKAFLPAISNVLGAFVKTDKQSKDNSKSFDSLGRTIYRISNIVIVLGATISNLGAVTKIAWNALQNAFIGGGAVVLKAMQLVMKGLGKDTGTIDAAITDLADQSTKNFNDMGDAIATMKENSETITTALEQVFNPTNYKAVEETAGAIDGLSEALGEGGGGAAGAAKGAKEEVEDFTEKIIDLRDEAIKAREELEKDFSGAVTKFGENLTSNFSESVTSLAQIVIKAEEEIKKLKESLKADDITGDQRKEIKKQIKAQEEILNSREDFEERQSERIGAIRTKLEEAGIDTTEAGLDNALSLRTLEEQIEEDKRIASLDEFERFEEAQSRKLALLTDSFITEATLLQNKIEKQKEYEADITAFLLNEDEKRLENTEVWANATISKYAEVANSVKSLLSAQSQVKNLQLSSITPTQVPRGDITPPVTGGTTNNSTSTTVNAPVTINGQSISNLNAKELSAILGFELNKFIR